VVAGRPSPEPRARCEQARESGTSTRGMSTTARSAWVLAGLVAASACKESREHVGQEPAARAMAGLPAASAPASHEPPAAPLLDASLPRSSDAFAGYAELALRDAIAQRKDFGSREQEDAGRGRVCALSVGRSLCGDRESARRGVGRRLPGRRRSPRGRMGGQARGREPRSRGSDSLEVTRPWQLRSRCTTARRAPRPVGATTLPWLDGAGARRTVLRVPHAPRPPAPRAEHPPRRVLQDGARDGARQRLQARASARAPCGHLRGRRRHVGRRGRRGGTLPGV
jgi:hypothetical protein